MRLIAHLFISSLLTAWLRRERRVLMAQQRYWLDAAHKAPHQLLLIRAAIAAIDNEIKEAQPCAR